MRNHLFSPLLTAIFIFSSLLFCKTTSVGQSPKKLSREALASLLAYKKSPHKLFIGYLVGDGNDPEASYNMLNVPDSVDIIEGFAGYDENPDHWRALQAKGTRIVYCSFPKNDAYFDGSIKDPATKEPGYVAPPNFNNTRPNANSTYNNWAKAMYNKYIKQMGWDGIDVDIERGTFGNDAPATNAVAVLTAIAKYFGPNAGAGNLTNAGLKPLFLYDTDVDTQDSEPLSYGRIYTPYKSNYDYALFQCYVGGARRWKGSKVTDLTPLLPAFGKDKLIVMTNGDEWLYQNGGQDSPPNGDAKATQWLLDIAKWTKDNDTQGIGAYRMSRDYNHTPHFKVSRESIQIMNPSK